MTLQNTSLDPKQFVWKISSCEYEPVGTLDPISPVELQDFICCGCKQGCENNRCTCIRNMLKYVSACSECHEVHCSNVALQGDEAL